MAWFTRANGIHIDLVMNQVDVFSCESCELIWVNQFDSTDWVNQKVLCDVLRLLGGLRPVF